MKLLNLLNPQAWLGQIIVLLFFVSTGVIGGFVMHMKLQEPCPPTTAISIDQKNKAKKGSTVNNDITSLIGGTSVSDSLDCEAWLQSLSMKEIRRLRK